MQNQKQFPWNFSVKKVFVKTWHTQESICTAVSLLIKSYSSSLHSIKKYTPAQVFSCEFCEVFRNTYVFCRPYPIGWFWKRMRRNEQGFGKEKNENHGEFKGSILVIFCCKEFEKFSSYISNKASFIHSFERT